IVLVIGGAGKLGEVREILAQGEAIDIESRDLDSVKPALTPEIQETTQEIAIEKCQRAAEIVSVVDLSLKFSYPSLSSCVLACPISRVSSRDWGGCEGINRMLDSFTTRAGWALCTFAYSAGPSTEPVLFEGLTDGKIVPPRGTLKFGWGPVFETEDNGLIYTEMDAIQKHAVSHRGRALQNLRAYLLTQGGGVGDP
ncbi:Ham1-like protein, partial [Lactarius indigo]